MKWKLMSVNGIFFLTNNYPLVLSPVVILHFQNRYYQPIALSIQCALAMRNNCSLKLSSLFSYTLTDLQQTDRSVNIKVLRRKGPGACPSAHMERGAYIFGYSFITLAKYPSSAKCDSQVFSNPFNKNMTRKTSQNSLYHFYCNIRYHRVVKTLTN